MRSERQALADIEKLYEDDKWWGTGEHALRREVRAILADVQPEPAPGAGEPPMLGWKWCPTCGSAVHEGDPLKPEPAPADPCQHMTRCADGACKYRMAATEPAPASGTIDRDALIAHIRDTVWDEYEASATADEVADGILALVRPVEGVVLTFEEAGTLPELLRYWVHIREQQGITGPIVDRPRVLAERLEAAL